MASHTKMAAVSNLVGMLIQIMLDAKTLGNLPRAIYSWWLEGQFPGNAKDKT